MGLGANFLHSISFPVMTLIKNDGISPFMITTNGILPPTIPNVSGPGIIWSLNFGPDSSGLERQTLLQASAQPGPHRSCSAVQCFLMDRHKPHSSTKPVRLLPACCLTLSACSEQVYCVFSVLPGIKVNRMEKDPVSLVPYHFFAIPGKKLVISRFRYRNTIWNQEFLPSCSPTAKNPPNSQWRPKWNNLLFLHTSTWLSSINLLASPSLELFVLNAVHSSCSYRHA